MTIRIKGGRTLVSPPLCLALSVHLKYLFSSNPAAAFTRLNCEGWVCVFVFFSCDFGGKEESSSPLSQTILNLSLIYSNDSQKCNTENSSIHSENRRTFSQQHGVLLWLLGHLSLNSQVTICTEVCVCVCVNVLQPQQRRCTVFSCSDVLIQN